METFTINHREFFKGIRDSKYNKKQLTKIIGKITNSFSLKELLKLEHDFEKYVHIETEIRSASLSLDDKMNHYRLYGNQPDPHIVTCLEFKSHLKAIITRLQKTGEVELPEDSLSDRNEMGTDPKSFSEIFSVPDWKKYIDALNQVEDPILSGNYKFIGKPRRDKGVICSWIKTLQHKGIINRKFNRQQLASVLNNEIEDLNLGTDGKTIDTPSDHYDKKYDQQLKKHFNLLP